MDSNRRPRRYRCLSGHEIPANRLEEESEVVVLDTGAEVRVCRKHGAPVAISVPAAPPGETA